MVLTPGNGWHVWFKYPGKLGTTVIAPGVELRADGAMTIAPECRRAGKGYDYVNGYRFPDLAPLPNELLAGLKRSKAKTKLDKAVDEILATPPGQRHNKLRDLTFSLAFEVVAGRLDQAEFRQRIADVAMTCDPPYDKLGVENLIESAIDKAKVRARKPAADEALVAGFPDIEPWPEPVEGAVALDEVARLVRRYVVLGDARLIGVTFWIACTHFLDIATHAPRLAMTSPRQRCGKTTLLRVIAELTPRPINTENVSVAVLYHLAERVRPTFLLDEIDNQLAVSNPDARPLRSILNSGHEVSGRAWRMSGEGAAMVPTAFKTFAMAALAGIGRIDGPLGDRCIHIPLQRRMAGETVQRFDYTDRADLHTCRARLARFAVDNAEAIDAAAVELPAQLNDRAADNWRLAFKIAAIAGGDWPEKLRKAAIALSAHADADEDDLAVMLLNDCRDICNARALKADEAGHLPEEWIRTKELIAALVAIEERPWSTFGKSGKELSPAQLARLLKPFGVRPSSHDFAPSGSPKRDFAKGYEWRAFDDPWRRYAPPTP